MKPTISPDHGRGAWLTWWGHVRRQAALDRLHRTSQAKREDKIDQLEAQQKAGQRMRGYW